MTQPPVTFPVTYWFSTLGVGDGQDYATRGYLRALNHVQYEHVMISPRGCVDLRSDGMDEFSGLFQYPPAYQNKIVRVGPGDPRIGSRWGHLSKEFDVVGGATPVGVNSSFKFDNLIREGDTDHHYYAEHPEKVGSQYQPQVECLVVHHSPNQLVTLRDSLARETNGATPIVGITTWEPNRIPMAIAQSLSDLDALIVPSMHAAEVFMDSGFEQGILIVPHVLDIDETILEQSFSEPRPDTFNFYSIGTAIPRKNLETALVAFLVAMAGKSDVRLLMKTNGSQAQAGAMLEKALIKAASIDGGESRPEVRIIVQKFSRQQLMELHAWGDCFLSATRGEGFGLCEAEALAFGNDVITSSFGAQAEFDLEYYRTPCELVPVDDTMSVFGAYSSAQYWGDPDFDALVEMIREAYEKAAPASRYQSQHMLETYGKEAVGKRLSQCLNAAKRG